MPSVVKKRKLVKDRCTLLSTESKCMAKKPKGGMFYLDAGSEGAVHRFKEGLLACALGSWSHHHHSRDTEVELNTSTQQPSSFLHNPDLCEYDG